jgi:hypothetical protein
MNSDIRRLHYQRGTRIKTMNGVPSKKEGSDGDIIISRYKGDIYLFAKIGGRWYNSRMIDGFTPNTGKQ